MINPAELEAIDAYWRAANYLTVGQIYLRANPLLREPLAPEHIKPRLLGHWGTSPGLSLLYAHVNRVIRERDVEVLYLAGPGHGGPAILANVYLEGTYSEIYPDITGDERGMDRLFRQFSTPGGVPSHVGPSTPGSIHEGGELGYVLAHAFGAVFDNPSLVALAVIGDGEAETGPLAGSWKGIRFLNAARDGAVLPVLHLNGYKISGPTVMGREDDASLGRLFEGLGYRPRFVEGDAPAEVHRRVAEALDACLDDIATIQHDARARGVRGVPAWPLIVLRTPKGWTGPKAWRGVPIEGTFRAHQVPLTSVRSDREQLAMLEAWMRSYRPDELFDERGRLIVKGSPDPSRFHGVADGEPWSSGDRIVAALSFPWPVTFARMRSRSAHPFRGWIRRAEQSGRVEHGARGRAEAGERHGARGPRGRGEVSRSPGSRPR